MTADAGRRCARPSRFASPGRAFCSWTTTGVPRRRAARYAGVATYPPKPTTTSAAVCVEGVPGGHARRAAGWPAGGAGRRRDAAGTGPWAPRAAGTPARARAATRGPAAVPRAVTPHVGVASAQAVGEGEQRRDVAGGATTGEQHRPGTAASRAGPAAAGRHGRQHGEGAAQGRGARGQRLGTPRLGPREGQQDAEGEHRRDERRPAGGHERQRHADDRAGG